MKLGVTKQPVRLTPVLRQEWQSCKPSDPSQNWKPRWWKFREKSQNNLGQCPNCREKYSAILPTLINRQISTLLKHRNYLSDHSFSIGFLQPESLTCILQKFSFNFSNNEHLSICDSFTARNRYCVFKMTFTMFKCILTRLEQASSLR